MTSQFRHTHEHGRELQFIIEVLRPRWPVSSLVAVDAHMRDAEYGSAIMIVYGEGADLGFHGQQQALEDLAQRMGEPL